MSRKTFVDANIPMYAAGANSPQKLDCATFIRAVAGGKVAGVTSVEILQEILHRYLHLKRPEMARQVYDSFRAVVHEVLPIDASDLDRARQLMDKYPKAKARDLLHLSVMIHHNIKVISSYDHDFDSFSEVERIEPASP